LADRETHHSGPERLRHNATTELRRESGLETARIILGHHSAVVTELYARKDERHAVQALAAVG